jgi:DNA-binding HxlR family transcriptional regulator
MQRSDFSEMQCSVTRALDVFGDTWTPLVLRDIALGISRFDAIQRNLGLSRKVLTQRLNALVEHGVVQRTPYQDNPPRHDYTLTEQGTDLAMVLVVLQAYGDKWILGKDNAPLVWKHLTCGHLSSPVLCCDRCGEQIRPEDALPLPGPGFVAHEFPVLGEILQSLAAMAEA